jgi:hypothetical protein
MLGAPVTRARPGTLACVASLSKTRARRAVSLVVGLLLTALVVPHGSQAQEPDEPGNGAALDSERARAGAQSQPSGAVAYVSADRRVWLGSGNSEPVEVGALAAFGPNGQAAVAVSPTGESVAYVRADGSLAVVGADGSGTLVVATDVALDAIGEAPILTWDGTGDQIAYVARGTEDQVEDASTRPRSKATGSHLAPLPDGPLGNVLAIVDAAGGDIHTSGDPSQRSVIGIATSLNDPLVVVQTAIPGSSDRYTLALAMPGSREFSPTPFSADDPDFSPDGAFMVYSGPSKRRRELTKVELSTLSRDVLTTDDTVCSPVVSPDSTRVVYGGGPDCSRLMLVSTEGGRSFDITPLDAPDTASFGEAALGWTSDGRFVTFPDCTRSDGLLECGGPSVFIEPDSGRVLSGPDAVTVAPIRRTLIQDIWADFTMGGPTEVQQSFPISAEIEGALTDTGSAEVLAATFNNGTAVLDARLTASEDGFVTGTIKVDDPTTGVDQTLAVLARTSLLGLRIVSMTGIWISTTELPFATGEFTLAIRRR